MQVLQRKTSCNLCCIVGEGSHLLPWQVCDTQRYQTRKSVNRYVHGPALARGLCP
uniref:Uncharacterized protein n=1 Tax=Brassica campestris TaxID=3711 RepID=A0A3P5ZCE2_BRACM|nr:unnamed protein product [Brassica rapa]